MPFEYLDSGSNKFEYLDQPGFIEKASSNVVPDIMQMVLGLANHVASSPAMDIAQGDIATALPKLFSQGKELLANPKETLSQTVRPIVHPIDYAQEHPVQQALNVLGAGQLAVGGVGSALNAIPATENVLPTLERIANNQTLKGFGGTMGQIRQMSEGQGGRAALDSAAQLARDKGLSDVFTTDIGREKALQGLLKSSGEKVGALRKEAGSASTNPTELISKLLDNPRAKMAEYLGEGMASNQLPLVDKAIADIQRIGGTAPTHADLAKAATYINDQAAGSKLYQPVTAATDVANSLSDINNQGIAQALGSDKAQQYLTALEDQKKLHPLEHLQARGELRQMGGRGGIGLQMVQKIADEFGYRLSAKTVAAIHDSLVGQGLGITKAAVASKLATLSDQQTVSDLIQKLKAKYDARRKF